MLAAEWSPLPNERRLTLHAIVDHVPMAEVVAVMKATGWKEGSRSVLTGEDEGAGRRTP